MLATSTVFSAGARRFVADWCHRHLSGGPNAEIERVVNIAVDMVDDELGRRDVWAHLRRREDHDAWRPGRYDSAGDASGVAGELAAPVRLALGQALPLLTVIDPCAPIVEGRWWSIVVWRDRTRILYSGPLDWPSDLCEAAAHYRSHFESACAGRTVSGRVEPWTDAHPIG